MLYDVIQYLKTRVHIACISNITQPTGTCNCICWPYSSISTTRLINTWRCVMDRKMKLNQICIFHHLLNCNLELNCKYKEYYHPQFDLQTFLLSEKKICLQCFQLRVFSQKSFWRIYQHLLGRNHRVLKYEVKFILPLKLLFLQKLLLKELNHKIYHKLTF